MAISSSFDYNIHLRDQVQPDGKVFRLYKAWDPYLEKPPLPCPSLGLQVTESQSLPDRMTQGRGPQNAQVASPSQEKQALSQLPGNGAVPAISASAPKQTDNPTASTERPRMLKEAGSQHNDFICMMPST